MDSSHIQALHEGSAIPQAAPDRDASIEHLMRLAQDSTQPTAMRSRALYVLALSDAQAAASALVPILAAPDEDLALRCDAADHIGGLKIVEAIPTLRSLLATPTTHHHLIFWCLYAAGHIQDEGAEALMRSFLHDTRTISLEPCWEISLDQEARLALHMLAPERYAAPLDHPFI